MIPYRVDISNQMEYVLYMIVHLTSAQFILILFIFKNTSMF